MDFVIQKKAGFFGSLSARRRKPVSPPTHRQARRARLLHKPSERLPVLEEQVGRALVGRPELLAEVFLELRHHTVDIRLVPTDRVRPA